MDVKTQEIERTEQGMGLATVTRGGEVASAAMAAKARSVTEARYVMALNRPRSVAQARINILDACRRPAFAESARYRKPVGGNNTVDGFSIRFAEEAIKAMTNISVDSMTIFEDYEKRIVQVTVTDLETNVTYGKDIAINKTVERRSVKAGQPVLSKRINSSGITVYLVEATEDETANKIASAESKVIRNCGLRLLPSDILEEAETLIEQTLTTGGADTKESVKKIQDAFAKLNISPVDLDKYLGHSMATVSPKELANLRAIYSTIKDGEASWADYLTDAKPAKPDLDRKPKEPAKPEINPDDYDIGDHDVGKILTELLESNSVPIGDFMSWLSSTSRDRKYQVDALSMASVSELPAQLCADMVKDTKAMASIIKTFGTPPPLTP